MAKDGRKSKATSGSKKDSSKEARQEQPKRKVLRIGIVQKGRIIDEKVILKPKTVTIGRSAGNTFLIPSLDLPRVYKVFEYKNGKYLLNFSKGMDGRFAIDGKVYTLKQLIENGKHVQKVREHYQFDLSVCDRGKLVVGSLTILFHFVPEPRKRPKPKLPHSMWGIYSLKSWMGGVFTASLVFFVFIWAPATIAGLRWMYVKYDLAHTTGTSKKAQAYIRNLVKHRQEKIEKKKKEEKKKLEGVKVDKVSSSKKADKKKAARKKARKHDTKKDGGGDKNKPAVKTNNKDVQQVLKDKNLKKLDSLKALDKIGDIDKVGDANAVPDIPVGDIKADVNMPKIDTSGALSGGAANVEIGPVSAGGAKVLAVNVPGSDCKGPNCVSAASAFKPGSSTEGNVDPSAAIVVGGGGVSGPGGKKGGRRRPKVKISGPMIADVMVPVVNLPDTNIKINTGAGTPSVPMFNIDSGMKAMKPMVMVMTIMSSGRVQGSLTPSSADPGAKKYMYRIKHRIVSCFRKAVKSGAISGSGGSLRVSYKLSADGSLSLVSLGGSLKNNALFSSCVRGAFRGKAKPVNGATFKPYTHTFTMILQATH